jgi:hypothetical protein
MYSQIIYLLLIIRKRNFAVPGILKGKLWKKGIDESVKFMITQNDVINHYQLRDLKYYVMPMKLVFEENPEYNCIAIPKKIDWYIGKNIPFIRTYIYIYMINKTITCESIFTHAEIHKK